jgi:integrase
MVVMQKDKNLTKLYYAMLCHTSALPILVPLMNANGSNAMNHTQLQPTTPGMVGALVTDLNADELNRIAGTAKRSTASATLRTYGSHIRAFASYCHTRGWAFEPGDVFTVRNADDNAPVVETIPNPARVDWVLAHLQSLADDGATLATIDGRVRALNRWHVLNGYTESTDPMTYRPNHSAVSNWLNGCQNEYAERNANGEQLTKYAPGILRNHLRAMVRACNTTTLTGLRDRAMLLIGWAGAFRRSELVGIHCANIVTDDRGRGVIVNIYNTKTNKRGATVKQIDANPNDPELCPVRALNEWLERANINDGVVFRRVSKSGRVLGALSPRFVDLIVREYDKRAAYDNATGAPVGFSAHSLRSGYATQATIDGIPDALIRAQGWADNSTVVFRYQRRAGAFMQRRIGVA